MLAGGGPVNSAVRRYFSLLPMVISELTDRSKDIFSVFRTAADRWFSFLITDFGFRLEFTKIDESMAFADMLTCELHYRNATTEIEVDYTWYKDLRGSPVVMVGQLQTTNDGSVTLQEAHNLDQLISERCADRALQTFPEDPIERVENTIEAYASLLADCAHNELTGDFDLFPRLRSALLAELRGRCSLIRASMGTN